MHGTASLLPACSEMVQHKIYKGTYTYASNCAKQNMSKMLEACVKLSGNQ
jgi:hypothetical protein